LFFASPPTLEAHIQHFHLVFDRFVQYNIALKPAKCFIGYLLAIVLGQRVDSMGLSTIAERVAAITQLTFLENLRQLEPYLGIVGWMQDKVPDFAEGQSLSNAGRRNCWKGRQRKDVLEKPLRPINLPFL
jgi:hypothetical protein